MKTAVQTERFLNGNDFDTCFRIAAECGFDGIDLNIDSKLPYRAVVSGDMTEFFSKSDEEILEAFRPCKEAAEKYGITLCQAHAPFPSLNGVDRVDDYVYTAIKKAIMICGYLNIPYVVIHPWFFGKDKKLDAYEEYRLNMNRYSGLIPYLKRYGVTACLENMFCMAQGKAYPACCGDVSEAVMYIDKLNETAGERCFAFCLDTGHCNLGGKDILDYISRLGDRLAVLHLNDNNCLSDQHIVPYAGTVDVDAIVNGLAMIDYKGFLSFETFGMMKAFPTSTHKECLQLISAVGRDMSDRIEKAKNSDG